MKHKHYHNSLLVDREWTRITADLQETSNLDATDGERYDKMIEELQRNQNEIIASVKVQNSLSLELIEKFNKTVQQISHNENLLAEKIDYVYSIFKGHAYITQPICERIEQTKQWIFVHPKEDVIKAECFDQKQIIKLIGTYLVNIPISCHIETNGNIIKNDLDPVVINQPLLFPDLNQDHPSLPETTFNLNLDLIKLDELSDIKTRISQNVPILLPTSTVTWTPRDSVNGALFQDIIKSIFERAEVSQYIKNPSCSSYDEDEREFLSGFLDTIQALKENYGDIDFPTEVPTPPFNNIGTRQAIVEKEGFPHSSPDIIMLPSEENCDTDEDSGQDAMSPNNLPSAQLRASGEIHVPHQELDSEDDNILL
nr:unnamed protein product [Callosobruchus chinensis]